MTYCGWAEASVSAQPMMTLGTNVITAKASNTAEAILTDFSLENRQKTDITAKTISAHSAATINCTEKINLTSSKQISNSAAADSIILLNKTYFFI